MHEPQARAGTALPAQPGGAQASDPAATVLPARRVFVSYKSEDDVRVAPLVQALKGQGFDVWWDRERLRPAESWAQDIADALGKVGCVVVVWTKRSAVLTDSYVFREARAARQRGVMVPVLLDRVRPPHEFEEIQCVDLSRWRGSPRDPCFQDLVAAARARMTGQPVPPAQCARRRLARQVFWGAAGTATTAIVAAAFNLFGAQDATCATFLQPHLSDACGALGLGHRPTRAERLAWQALPDKGNCAALHAHIARFPDGALRTEARQRIAAPERKASERWVPDLRRLPISTDATEPRRDEADARALAEVQARQAAAAACAGFTGREFRFDPAQGRADMAAPEWDCRRHDDGHRCRLKLAQVTCHLERKEPFHEERCGPP